MTISSQASSPHDLFTRFPCGSSNDKAFFDQVRANCRRGDVLVIPNNDTYRAARLCDFSQSITATGGHIVCVIAGPERPTR